MANIRQSILTLRSNLFVLHRTKRLTAALQSLIFVGAICASMMGSDATGQLIKPEDLETPLIENDPFDLLTLNKANDNAIIKIQPPEDLKLPLPAKGMFVFEFARDSEFPLKVPNSSIAKYETFNDLLLMEANQFLERNELSLAFRNLLYVYDNGGKKDPSLVQTLRTCLFLDARNKFENKEFEIALSIFEDLYQKQPNLKIAGIDRPLIEIVLACYDGIIQRKFDDEKFESVRSTFDVIRNRYGDVSSALIGKWDQRFDQRANQLLKKAKELAAQGDGREAHLFARKAERISPGRKQNETVQAEIMEQFPLIVVGVSQSAGEMDPSRIDHWGSRRVGRMIRRRLVEVAGLSDEGARYEFLNGSISRIDDVGLVYAFDLNEQTDEAVPSISSFQLAMRLLSQADPESDEYDATWAKILNTVEVQSETRVVVTLQRPFVRPEALMQIAYPTSSDGTIESAFGKQNGRYVMISQDSKFSFFAANQNFPALRREKHPVVIEQKFRTASDAVDAMLKGEVDVIDRIPPSDVARLKDVENIQVRSYVIPAVHLLIPKIRGDLSKSYRFRNALSTAIDRDSILNDIITGNTKKNEEIDGFASLSGPFPLGGDDNDQISYGYDLRVKPLKYNERLAMALTNIAMIQEVKNKADANSDDDDKKPSLVLAHQNSSLVKNCAEAIARSWNAAGITTTLRALPDGITYPEDDQWDVLYAELLIEEPVVDAIRMLGTSGFTDNISAPVEQSLRRLVTSQTWQEACLSLRNIHRQIAVDLSVIPLYQVKDHFAFRDNVYNTGRDLVHLYQNVDRWRIETLAQAKKRKELLDQQ